MLSTMRSYTSLKSFLTVFIVLWFRNLECNARILELYEGTCDIKFILVFQFPKLKTYYFYLI